MQIFDAHLDLALNAIDWNRDLSWTVDRLREEEQSLDMHDRPGRGMNTVSLPELQLAEVKTCLATLLARQEHKMNHAFGRISKHTCYAIAHAHLAYYRALESEQIVTIIRSRQELQAHTETMRTTSTAPLGVILTMEGADPLLTVDTLDEFYQSGLRAIGLTHYGDNRYGGGTNSHLGLAATAPALLERIAELGIILDLTHLSDRALDEVLACYEGPVHASHQNSRRLADWQRQYTDEQYRAVLERKGVIGIAFDIIMLQHDFERGKSELLAGIETAVENIDFVCQLAGNARQVGIGSDLDGGFGCNQTPHDLDRISDLQRIPDLLDQKGFSQEDIEGIMFSNWNDFFLSHLPAT